MFGNPPTRAQTISQLVAIFAPDRRAVVCKCWQTRTLARKPVQAADPTEFEIEAVALAGWALDQQANAIKARERAILLHRLHISSAKYSQQRDP